MHVLTATSGRATARPAAHVLCAKAKPIWNGTMTASWIIYRWTTPSTASAAMIRLRTNLRRINALLAGSHWNERRPALPALQPARGGSPRIRALDARGLCLLAGDVGPHDSD